MIVTANKAKKIEAESAFEGYSKPSVSKSYPLGRTRLFGVYCSSFRVLQLLIELFLVGVIFFVVLSASATVHLDGTPNLLPPSLLALVISSVLVLFNCCMGLYSTKQSVEAPDLLQRLGSSLFFTFTFVWIGAWLLDTTLASLETLAVATAMAFLFLYLGRMFTQKFICSEKLTKRVLILGNGHRADQVYDRLQSYSEGAYSLHRLNEPDNVNTEEFEKELIAFVASHNICEIVLAYADRRQKIPMPVLIECKLSGISVRDPIEFLERETGLIHFDFLDLSWIVFADGFVSDKIGTFFKRSIDIVGSAVLLTITLPIFLVAAAAIKLDKSGAGPIFYRQIRVGLHGKLFEVWKFRSMFTDAEASGRAVWATENDTRVTSVGAILRKYRVDELPQLMNVLKGEMSLVGPRPERPEFVTKLSDLHVLYNERHRVKPGLTGWAQMRFPYTASANDSIKKLQYDMYYVKNRSLLLDILILLQTVEVVLCGKGAR